MLVFNRIETTIQVFKVLKQIQPRYLYVVADGARAHKTGEAQKCEAVRQLFLTQIDWDCQLTTLYRTENLGCRKSVATGISWFFEQVEQGIILEDDCLPDLSFFGFCQEMLIKYKDNSELMHISGNQLLHSEYKNKSNNYLYNKTPYIWGWATWRRAWQLYDAKMENFNKFAATRLVELDGLGGFLKKKFIRNFELVSAYKLDTWDYQWTFSIWYNKGICVVPAANLVSNIGFGAEATHTNKVSHLANQPCSAISPNPQPLNTYPVDFQYDKKVFGFVYGSNLLIRAWRWAKSKWF